MRTISVKSDLIEMAEYLTGKRNFIILKYQDLKGLDIENDKIFIVLSFKDSKVVLSLDSIQKDAEGLLKDYFIASVWVQDFNIAVEEVNSMLHWDAINFVSERYTQMVNLSTAIGVPFRDPEGKQQKPRLLISAYIYDVEAGTTADPGALFINALSRLAEVNPEFQFMDQVSAAAFRDLGGAGAILCNQLDRLHKNDYKF